MLALTASETKPTAKLQNCLTNYVLRDCSFTTFVSILFPGTCFNMVTYPERQFMCNLLQHVRRPG